MYRLLIVIAICVTSLVPGNSIAQVTKQNLDWNGVVNLKEQEGTTIFKNATIDTVKLSGIFFNNLPYRENNFALKIAPGDTDTLKLQFTYPDFIFINQLNEVYNGPGGIVVCEIKQLRPKANHLTFTGNYEAQNIYYQAYFNYLGSTDYEGRPYYNAGDKLRDFNKFPAMADSITQIRLNFLNTYQPALPPAFKKHEYWRLVYNGAMRKYNVLDSKVFYGGKPIPVNASYYNFERDFKLLNNEMLINTEYLWATDFYLHRRAQKNKKSAADGMIDLIDSLCPQTTTGDILKMRRLSKFYMVSKTSYDSAYKATSFYQTDHKLTIDSLIQTKLGLPKIGNKVPATILQDISGNRVNLSAYAGKPIIINFWAEWCGPCIAEFPSENKLYQQYKDKGLVVINICVESDITHWQAISKRNQLQMINLFVDADTYKSLKAKFNVSILPRAILIDRSFKVTDNYFKRASLLTDKDIARIIAGP